MKMTGNMYHIIKAVKPLLTIKANVKPIEKDKNGAIATIRVTPHMINFPLFVRPLLKNIAAAKPASINDIEKKIAAIPHNTTNFYIFPI